MVVVLAAMLIAGQAYAGWGGGGRRGGGRGGFGPGPAPGVQDNTDERGPWMRPGPGRRGPDTQAWQDLAPGGGPGRGRGGAYALAPRAGGQRMARGLNRAGGPGSRLGRGNRAGRGYQGGTLCPYCQDSGQRPLMQGHPNRGQWGQGFRGGRAGGGFRGGAALTGRGAWRGPDRGNRGQGLRSGGVGRGFANRDFGPQGQWPMIPRRPMPDDRGQGVRPGRGDRGVFRGEAAPDGRGRGLGWADRDDRPLPGQGWGRDREDRPRLRRGPGVPAERPEVKDPNTEAPAEPETDRPVKDPPASDES